MNSDAAPEGRCGFTLSPEDLGEDIADRYEDETDEWHAWGPGMATCIRDTWNDTGSCIWHAEVNEKPVEELREARSDRGENLAGSYLAGIDTDDSISFQDCRLIASNFTDADLRWADFTDADLRWADLIDADLTNADLTNAFLAGADLTNAFLAGADLTNADLRVADLIDAYLAGADLTDADLQWADLTDAELREADLIDAYLVRADLTDAFLAEADLTNADLDGADLTDAYLAEADLTNAYLNGADLTDAYLAEADLTNADLDGADLTDANLSEATLTEADLTDADLSRAEPIGAAINEANLKKVNLTDADLTNADLTEANVEQANFTRTNLFDTDFTGARLYSALFADIQIDHKTTFGGHYVDDLDGAHSEIDSEESDEEVEEDGEDAESTEDEDDGPTPWEKARWTYRQLEEIAQRNAHPEKARDYYVMRKDVRRREYYAEGGIRNKLRWLWMEGYRWVMLYGESPRRVVGFSGAVIVAFSFLFLAFGGMQRRVGGQVETYGAGSVIPAWATLPGWLQEFWGNLYFSGVTFTTLGYGDIQPATPAVEFLATVESFLGALLMALLVFVLGRRTTW